MRINPEAQRINPEDSQINPEVLQINPEAPRINPEAPQINTEDSLFNTEALRSPATNGRHRILKSKLYCLFNLTNIFKPQRKLEKSGVTKQSIKQMKKQKT